MEISYDPHRAPNPEQWLMLDESERLHLIMAYHEEHQVSLPSPQAHAAFHVTVENQVAMGDEIPVAGHLRRLMKEGLDRHEAVHAIGSVLADCIYVLLKEQDVGQDVNQAYFRGLKKLTAKKWRKSGTY